MVIKNSKSIIRKRNLQKPLFLIRKDWFSCLYINFIYIVARIGSFLARSRSHSVGWLTLRCRYMFEFDLKVFEQYGHAYNIAPVCDAMCSFSVSDVLNDLSHTLHLKLAFNWWMYLVWLYRASLVGTVLPQIWHTIGPLILWYFSMWRRSVRWFVWLIKIG